MAIFALQEIEEVRGNLKIFKLSVDNYCEFDHFWQTIKKEGNLVSELKTIQARMMEIAECKSLPKTKFRDITPNKENSREYEIKKPHLRCICFMRPAQAGSLYVAEKKQIKKRTSGISEM